MFNTRPWVPASLSPSLRRLFVPIDHTRPAARCRACRRLKTATSRANRFLPVVRQAFRRLCSFGSTVPSRHVVVAWPLSPAPLVPKRCLQASLVLGALTCFVALPAVARLPCSIGLAVVLGAAASWSSPRLVRGYLFLVGVVLTAAGLVPVPSRRGWQSGMNPKSFGHSPGVLALGLAFGLRLLLDYGPVESAMRVRIAGAVGTSGLVMVVVARRGRHVPHRDTVLTWRCGRTTRRTRRENEPPRQSRRSSYPTRHCNQERRRPRRGYNTLPSLERKHGFVARPPRLDSCHLPADPRPWPTSHQVLWRLCEPKPKSLITKRVDRVPSILYRHKNRQRLNHIHFQPSPWARLIRKVFEVDPLLCKCGAEMKIIAVLPDPKVVDHIIRHLDKNAVAARSPPPISAQLPTVASHDNL